MPQQRIRFPEFQKNLTMSAPVVGNETSMASQCMTFCQTSHMETNPVIHIQVICRANSVIFRTNPDIFRTNTILFRTYTVIFRTNTVIVSTHQVLICNQTYDYLTIPRDIWNDLYIPGSVMTDQPTNQPKCRTYSDIFNQWRVLKEIWSLAIY